VDKRGRPLYNSSTDENLKRYYNIEEDEEKGEQDEPVEQKSDSSSSESECSDSREEDAQANNFETSISSKPGFSGTDTETKVRLSEKTRKKLRNADIDYARGDADFLSDEESSSDDSESDKEPEQSEMHGTVLLCQTFCFIMLGK